MTRELGKGSRRHQGSIRDGARYPALAGRRAGPVRVPWRLTVLLAMVCVLLQSVAVSMAWAQAEAFLEIEKGGFFKVPILIEDFTWRDLDPVLFQGRERAEEILANDLLYSDAFIVLREQQRDDLAVGLRLDVQGRPVDQPLQVRVRAAVSRDGSRLLLEGVLQDEGTGKKIFERGYEIGWDPEGLEADRWGIHKLADEIVFFLTGTRGCAATRIAFVRARQGVKEIGMVDWDGLNERSATRLQKIVLSPSWHPSGRWVAFTSFHLGQPAIVSLDLLGGGLELLSDQRTPTAVAYSRDGKQVAYSATQSGDAEIYLAHADGSAPRQLTFDAGIDTAPSWSPMGKRMVFTSDRWGNPQLFTINTDGTELQQLTFAGTWNDSPDWSPTGDRIVHVCRIDGEFELALIYADGWGWQRLTIGGGCENPRWAPDGRHVVFSRRVRSSRSLWILDVDSGAVRRLTHSKGDRYNPAWSNRAKERPNPLNQGR